MPAAKTARAALRKRAYNQLSRGAARTMVRKAEALLAQGDRATAEKAVKDAASALDKAVRKGAIHPNNAARHKSRLTQKLNAVRA